MIKEGTNVNISVLCEATGFPTPTVTWSTANGELINDTRNGNVYLTITNASREHTGMYMCTAENSLGNDSRSIRIIGRCSYEECS